MFRRSIWSTSLLIAATVLLAGSSLSAKVLDKTDNIGGTQLHYKVVLPNGYDPAKAYPTILAFPGGPQTEQMVEGILERNLREQAETQGYIVIVPAAPNGDLFFERGDRVFPAFLTRLLADYKVLGNKFHIAGVSNNGLSAFHIAALYPQYFISVTGLPGFLEDSGRMQALAGLCIYMYAGEMDPEWLSAERNEAAQFRKQGNTVEFNEEKGEGHVMRTLSGPGAARLFKQFAQSRQGCAK